LAEKQEEKELVFIAGDRGKDDLQTNAQGSSENTDETEENGFSRRKKSCLAPSRQDAKN